MEKIAPSLLLPFLIFVVIFFNPGFALGERPFIVTERAVPIEQGAFRLETGLRWDHISSSTEATTLSADLRYGLIPNLELDVEIPYEFLNSGSEHDNRFGDVLLRTKIRFLKGREANPLSVAGEILIKLPTAGRHPFFGTTGEADVGFIAIASKEFALTTAHINFGYILIGNPPFENRQDELRYALGLEFKTRAEPIKIIAELAGSTEVGSRVSQGLLSLLGGVSYEIDKNFMIDASIGLGLTSDTPDYTFNLGASFSFR